MTDTKTDLRVLQPSRKKGRSGDIFVYQMPDQRFRFGRLIFTDATTGGFAAHLIYLYKAESDVELPVPGLSPTHLLLPPLGTNHRRLIPSSAIFDPSGSVCS